jgi:hypothetical protein
MELSSQSDQRNYSAIATALLRCCGPLPIAFISSSPASELIHVLRLEGTVCTSHATDAVGVTAPTVVFDVYTALPAAIKIVRAALASNPTFTHGSVVYIGTQAVASEARRMLDPVAASLGVISHPMESRANELVVFEVAEEPLLKGDSAGKREFGWLRDAFTLGCIASESVRRGDTVLVAAAPDDESYIAVAHAISRASECEGVLTLSDAERTVTAGFSSERVQVMPSSAVALIPRASLDYVLTIPDVMLRPGDDSLLTLLADGGRVLLVQRNAEMPSVATHCPAWLIPERAWRGTPHGYQATTTGDPLLTLLLAMRKPIGPSAHGKGFYRESMYKPESTPGYVLYDFEHEWEQPALFRSMVCMGPRLADSSRLLELAAQAEKLTSADSPDRGAALCVQAYAALGSRDISTAKAILPRLAEYEQLVTLRYEAGTAPHRRRWVISNAYVGAKLRLLLGDPDAADEFQRCAGMDAGEFSPLLGTKTIDAGRIAGQLLAIGGNFDKAREIWTATLHEAERLVKSSWTNVWGDARSPQPYGLFELSHVLDAASYVAAWLDVLPKLSAQPGFAWVLARRQTSGDQRQYVRELEDAVRWFQSRAAATEGQAKSAHLELQLEAAHAWARDLEVGKRWLESQVEAARAENAKLEARAHSLSSWATELEAAKMWNEEQAANERREREAVSLQLEELKKWSEELRAAREWQEVQTRNYQAEVAGLGQQVTQLRVWADQLQEAKEWNQQQLSVATEAAREAGSNRDLLFGQIELLKAEISRLDSEHRAEIARMQKAAEVAAKDRADSEVDGRRLRESNAALDARIASLSAQVEQLEKLLNEAREQASSAEAQTAALKARGIWHRLLNTSV